ncbi:MAG TPA: hypothetical protein VFI52_03095 [Gemmatimonadaceae bacterium]|nr:hypothetical protein [Gemmatimonadaceae bacterium]
MTTPHTRSLVSRVAALTLTLALVGCASAPVQLARDVSAPTEEAPPSIRFDNDARAYVHVYLVGLRREWLLGRVAPGARVTLRVPQDALAEDEGPMRLAVLMGERITYRSAADVRTASALPRPAAEILSREWTFAPRMTGNELIALPFGRGRVR